MFARAMVCKNNLSRFFFSSGVILDWWRQILSSSMKRPHWHPTVLYLIQQDKNYCKFAALIDVFDLLE